MARAEQGGSLGTDAVGRLGVEDVALPAIGAGLLVEALRFLLGRIAALGAGPLLEPLVGALAGAVGTAGLLAALATIALEGPSERVLITGSVVVYATAFVARLVEGLLDGWFAVGLGALLDPLHPVVLFLGVWVALRWLHGTDSIAG